VVARVNDGDAKHSDQVGASGMNARVFDVQHDGEFEQASSAK
jgi:hypothetical protein